MIFSGDVFVGVDLLLHMIIFLKFPKNSEGRRGGGGGVAQAPCYWPALQSTGPLVERVSHVLIVVELEIQWRVPFDPTMNTTRKQHVIFSVLYISLSHDWLSLFGFLLTIQVTSGTVMGNSFVLFDVSIEIS